MRILLLVFIVFINIGCSSKKTQITPQVNLKDLRVVTVSNPQIKITPTTPLTWYSALRIHSDKQTSEKESFEVLLSEYVETNLLKNGFDFKIDQQNSKLQVIAVAMIGDNKVSNKLLTLYQLYPKLSNSNGFKYGTLIVAIIDTENKTTVWKGTVRMFLDTNLPLEQRKLRAKHAVEKLINRLKSDV